MCTELGELSTARHDVGERCLRNCQSDTDCDSFSRCQDAVCQLRSPALVIDPADAVQ